MGKNGETPNPGGGQRGGNVKIPHHQGPIKGGYPSKFIGKITGRDTGKGGKK